jgi:hypothetical protein
MLKRLAVAGDRGCGRAWERRSMRNPRPMVKRIGYRGTWGMVERMYWGVAMNQLTAHAETSHPMTGGRVERNAEVCGGSVSG